MHTVAKLLKTILCGITVISDHWSHPSVLFLNFFIIYCILRLTA